MSGAAEQTHSHYQTVRKWVHEGKLQGYEIPAYPNMIFVKVADVDRLLEPHPIESVKGS
jgi:hypothetical protein